MEDERRKEKRKIEEVIPQELLKLPCWVGYQLRRNKDRIDLPPKKWTQRRVGVSIKAGS